MEALQVHKGGLTAQQEAYRRDVVTLEERIRDLPGSYVGDEYPLTHTFTDGMYVRQITMPANNLIVSKIHAKTHPYFLLKGRIAVMTENGEEILEAPYSGVTQAGTKRVLWTYEETVFTTVHATNETDLDKIEEEIIAKDFEELESRIHRDISSTEILNAEED